MELTSRDSTGQPAVKGTPVSPTYAFVVGCPRSGTTWLQMLLAQHPRIATAQETHLFNNYIAPMQRMWKGQASSTRGTGLHAALTEEQFDALCADFAHQVMARIAERGNDPTVVLEKTPGHVRAAPLIVKLLPDARFVHLIRDPRAAVASLCAAGRSWGHAWASTDPLTNARLWVSDVTAGHELGSLTKYHYELKYEDLLADDGWRVLQALFHWLGLESDDEFSRDVLARCAIDRLRNHAQTVNAGELISGDPADFYRKGKADTWRNELSPRDVRIVEYVAGDAMRAYGYAPVTDRAKLARKPSYLKRRELVDSFERRARRALARSFDQVRRLM